MSPVVKKKKRSSSSSSKTHISQPALHMGRPLKSKWKPLGRAPGKVPLKGLPQVAPIYFFVPTFFFFFILLKIWTYGLELHRTMIERPRKLEGFWPWHSKLFAEPTKNCWPWLCYLTKNTPLRSWSTVLQSVATTGPQVRTHTILPLYSTKGFEGTTNLSFYITVCSKAAALCIFPGGRYSIRVY